MKHVVLGSVGCVLAVFGLVALSGCASTEETGAPDELTKNVGKYPPPPDGLIKPRVGVPNFKITGEGSSAKMEEFAAAQLCTLAYKTKRFEVYERDQLEQLLKEQNMEGIIKSDEIPKPGQVRGVDYLFYGKITNLRIKVEKTSRGLGIGDLGILGIGGFDYNKKDVRIVTNCGVDLKLVNTTSGKIDVANFSEYNKTDSVGAFGVKILGVGAEADADVQISEDDKGKILRLALDDAVRKMILEGDLDEALEAFTRQAKKAAAAAPAPAPAPAAPTAPAVTAPAVPAATTPAAPDATAAQSFCPNCGGKLAAGAKFCGSCGAKL